MWEEIIIKPFINILLLINSTIGNFGVAIILFTLLIKVVTHPLTVRQIKGMSATQELNKDPRMVALQAKYKNDKEKLQAETMKLYQEMGINPLSQLGGSCLPLLIQFPIMIGLYQSLTQSNPTTPLELVTLSKNIYPWLHNIASVVPINSQFLWMDIGQVDKSLVLFGFGVPIMAIVVVATSWLQSKVMAPPPDPSNAQAASMSASMNIMMPLMMGFICLSTPSGLALYFAVSNILGIGQYALLGKANWDNIIPGRKPALQPSKGASRPRVGSKLEVKPEPPVLPARVEQAVVEDASSKPVVKTKKANITKPVKSGVHKTK
jgi:YidC/Oxa1 family membrane protein insertase